MSKQTTKYWNAMASTGILVMFLSLVWGSRFMFVVGAFLGVWGSLAMIYGV